MASNEYRRLAQKSLARARERETPEGRYWRRFRNPVTERHINAVTAIHFCPKEPYDYAVTSSTRVHIYSSRARASKRALSRFGDTAYSGRFRNDGKLLVAGCEDSVVRVFDVGTRAVLRSFSSHTRGVRSTLFTHDNKRVVSGSDDKTARVWDLATHEAVGLLPSHGDYVRATDASPASDHMVVTGSYDHKVRWWDLRRQDTPVFTVDHGAPIESVLAMPSGSLMISAGGTEVKVWDVLGGGRLVHTLSNHQKTIMSLCLDGTGTRLLTGALDGHVKVYDVSTYSVTHGLKYTSPLLCVALPPDNSLLAAGTVDGELSVRRRQVGSSSNSGSGGNGIGIGASTSRNSIRGDGLGRVRSIEPRGGTYRFFMRGKGAKAAADDYAVERARKVNLKQYDLELRSFNYQAALDAALATRQPRVVAGMMEELIMRSGLQIALSGRDEVSLEPVLSFLVRYITDPRFASLLLDVCATVFDLYAPILGQSVVIDGLFMRLSTHLRSEVRLQRDMLSLIGSMETILAASQSTATARAEAQSDTE